MLIYIYIYLCICIYIYILLTYMYIIHDEIAMFLRLKVVQTIAGDVYTFIYCLYIHICI
jgi:hypothetical protein